MDVLAIGGTGFIGRRAVAELETRGHDVWTLGRGPGGSRHITCDRSLPVGLGPALAGHDFDAVVDLACYHPREAADAVRTLGGRVSCYVFISSGVVHRDLYGRPAREEDAHVPLGETPNSQLNYASGKRWCEAVLIRARGEGFPVTTVRPPAVLGREDRTSRVAGYLARIEDGGPLLVPEGGSDRRIGVAWTRDIAALCAMLVEGDPPSYAYNVGFPEVTLRAFVAAAAAALGKQAPDLVEVPEARLDAAGLELYGVSPYGPALERPGGYDLSRLRGELGFEPSPLDSALGECVAWYRAARPEPAGYQKRAAELDLADRLRAELWWTATFAVGAPVRARHAPTRHLRRT